MSAGDQIKQDVYFEEGGCARGYSIPAGVFNIVFLTCEHGLVACAAFNADVLQTMGRPCAIVRGVKAVEDLLNARIVAANDLALQRGVREGMSGRQAAEILSRS